MVYSYVVSGFVGGYVSAQVARLVDPKVGLRKTMLKTMCVSGGLIGVYLMMIMLMYHGGVPSHYQTTVSGRKDAFMAVMGCLGMTIMCVCIGIVVGYRQGGIMVPKRPNRPSNARVIPTYSLKRYIPHP